VAEEPHDAVVKFDTYLQPRPAVLSATARLSCRVSFKSRSLSYLMWSDRVECTENLFYDIIKTIRDVVRMIRCHLPDNVINWLIVRLGSRRSSVVSSTSSVVKLQDNILYTWAR